MVRTRLPKHAESVVLLVEPPDDSRDMYVEFLRLNGFSTIAVSEAEKALTFAPRADVIVTGILLAGGTNGIDLTARLRGDRRTRHKSIIVLTACALPADRARAEAAGCDLFLAKPCLPEELLREVRRRLPASKLPNRWRTPLKASVAKSTGHAKSAERAQTKQGRSA